MQDIAMISGDLVVTEFGDISVVMNEDDDIIQMANNNIMTILGENVHHDEVGNDAYNKRLKISASGFAIVETDSKDAIKRDTRVDSIKKIKASRGINLGECTIEYTLLTVDGHTLDGRISINVF